MLTDYLEKLHRNVEYLLKQEEFSESVKQLKAQLANTSEPFVWSVIDIGKLPFELPEIIKSGWIFVLKKDIPSGSHYHPNSIQHMIMIEGEGESVIANQSRPMIGFDAPNHQLDDIWYVIDKNIPHQFFPKKSDMVVVSFHTCSADQLEEIADKSGEKRYYQQ
jgi:hypothetical protein